MSKPFPGPRTALLWQYGRGFIQLTLVGTPIALYLAHFATRREDGYLLACGFAIGLFLLTAAGLGSEEGFRPFQWRLPVKSRTVVNVELGLVLAEFLWLLLCYSIAYRLFSPQSVFPTPWTLPCMTGAGFLAVLVSRSFEHAEGRMIALGLAIGALFLAFDHYGPTISPQQQPYVVFLCTLPLGYGLTLYGTRIMRQGGRPLKEYVAARVESITSPLSDDRGIPSVQLPVALASLRTTIDTLYSNPHERRASPGPEATQPCGRSVESSQVDAFLTPVEAHAWYELQSLRDLRTLLMRGYDLLMCLVFALYFFSTVFQDPLVVRFALALSVLHWPYGRFLAQDAPFLYSVPLSEWTRTAVRFRLSWPILMVLGPMRWLMVFLLILFLVLIYGKMPFATLSNLPDMLFLLGTTFWVGWISLALGLAITGLLCIAVACSFFGELPATQFGVILVALYVVSPIGLACRWNSEKLFPHGAACIAASLLTAAGYFVLPLLSLSPLAHWTCREALGALLILVLLQHHGAMGLIPWHAMRQLRRALLGGVGALWLIILLFGPPDGPEQGITAIYLAFGVVPPLFLPFLIVPYFVKLNAR